MSRECYLHKCQRIVRLYLSPWIYWKWTRLHRYLMRFFCNHFHQREKHYHRCKTCFASVPCMKKEMSVLRPEDNVDNDIIVLNKRLVLKKISTGKGRLDRWAYRTEQQCIDGFSDIDECKGNHSCLVNATCMNTKGSYVCTCHPGYTGNGSDCTGT